MTQLPDDELISAYLDGELSGGELARAEHLLATNIECRQLFEELTALRARLRALPKSQLSDDFAATVLRRAEREMLQPSAAPRSTAIAGDQPTLPFTSWRRWARPLVWSGLAAAAALLIMAFSPEKKQVAVGPAPMGGELGAAHDKAESGRVAEAPAEHSPVAAAAPAQWDADNSLALGKQLELREFLAQREALSTAPEELLVVRCDVDTEGEVALRQLLIDQKIDWEDQTLGAVATPPDVALAPAGADAGKSQKPQSKMLRARPVQADAVLVTARPEQLRAALGVLAKNRAFRHVTVEEATAPAGEIEALSAEPQMQQDAGALAADTSERDAAAPPPQPEPSAEAAKSQQLQTMQRQLKQLARSRAQRVPLAQVQSQLRLADGVASAVPLENAQQASPSAPSPADQSGKRTLLQAQRSESLPKPAPQNGIANKQSPGEMPAPTAPPLTAEPSAPGGGREAGDTERSADLAIEPQSHVLFLFRVAPAAAGEAPR